MEFTLKFTEPGDLDSYNTMTWYKPNRGSKIVTLDPKVAGGRPQYYGDFCTGIEPCYVTDKGQLDTTTGELTLYRVNVTDEGFYYYEFTSFDTRFEDTGIKYEIHLEVYGKLKNVTGFFVN